MFIGEPAFKGGTASDIIAAVLTKEPDLSKLPVHVRTVIEKCLRKDVRMRWQAIGDVRIALEENATAAPEPARHAWFKPRSRRSRSPTRNGQYRPMADTSRVGVQMGMSSFIFQKTEN
jgi:hypothetical protein